MKNENPVASPSGSTKGVVKAENGAGGQARGGGDDVDPEGKDDEAARAEAAKAAEQHALRLAALAVLDESSEDQAKVIG